MSETDKRMASVTLFLDIAEALDPMAHSHLSANARALGVTGPILPWPIQYLS